MVSFGNHFGMELKLSFPFAPLLQNNIERTGGRTNIRYKTDEANIFRRQVEMQMRTTQWAYIKDFKDFFNENIHGLSIEFIWHLNADKLLVKGTKKKKRRLSKTGGDVDGFVKYTQDCIMDYLDINDGFIKSSHERKVPSMEPSYFEVRIMISELASDNDYAAYL